MRAAVSRASGVLALVVLAAGCTAPSDSAEGPADEPTAATAQAPAPTPAERLGLEGGWGPSPEQLDVAARTASRLPLPALAGQVIVADYSGTRPPVALVRRLHLGGVIAFSDNLTTPAAARSAHRSLQRAIDRPLLVSVDQEGGIVERLRATGFPALMSAGAAGDVVLTQSSYAAQAAELAWAGFTVDFAPTADLTSGPGDPTIGSRSAGSRPQRAAEQVVAAARGYLDSGVLPALKHFPGHGSVPADSHRTLPVQTRSLEQLRRLDLVPFRAGIEAGLPMVMVGHLDVRAVDPRTPSSLSRPVVTGLLREELGFAGVAVTDSLQMAGVTAGRSSGQLAVQALRAGNDLLLMPPDPAAARAGIVRAVRSGDLPRRRLEQAAARVLALLDARPRSRPAPPGSAAPASRALSTAALTSVAGPCSGALVAGTVSPSGDPDAVRSFAAAAQAAGLTVLLRRSPPPALARPKERPDRRKAESRRAYRQRVAAWRAAERRRERRLERFERAETARLAAGTSVALAGYSSATGPGWATAQVAVATDVPYVLGTTAAPVRLATYGISAGAMGALVDVLLGRAPAPGALPVDVDGVERPGC